MWEGLTKKWVKKTKKTNILPSAGPGTRQRGPLPSARKWHSAKNFLKKTKAFAECRALCVTRQSHSLPSAGLCRVPPGPALGKEWLRRVPDFLHSAKLVAFSKSEFSRSGYQNLLISVVFGLSNL